eukprot:GHVS01030230.1.p1 GENE.GHVS01030230.1~~GHVS01030230.1.p1  ORF type:complete len:250 (-),score=66.43 GHVS01030230.1:57-806(-)
MNGLSSPAKPKFSFGIKRKPTSSTASSAPEQVRGVVCGHGVPLFEDVAREPTERTEQLLSIGVGGMETTGGGDRTRVIVCKKKLPPVTQRKEAAREEGVVKEEIRVKVERVEEQEEANQQDAQLGVHRPILSKPGWGLQVKVKKEEQGEEEVEEEEGEVEVFRRQLRRYPDMSRHAYDQMPVEEFGLAMLRGMGYVPEEEGGQQPVQPYVLQKRAYARAGLGADEKVLLPTEKDIPENNSSGKRPIKTP